MTRGHIFISTSPVLFLPSFLSLPISFTSPMASSQLSFACRQMIEDVVDVFAPSITMCAYYGSKLIINSCTINPSIADKPPRITITGYPRDLYTLVMTDPDAPSPNEPYLREYVHWIITDIPGGTNPAQGKEILPYISPLPDAGIHRFILVLYKQKGPLGFVDPLQTRINFCSRAFARQMELVAPVAVVYFHAQKELNKHEPF